jgi:hypothetical protein
VISNPAEKTVLAKEDNEIGKGVCEMV